MSLYFDIGQEEVNQQKNKRKIYLAGPDVFRKDPIPHFESLKKLCEKYGFKGFSPFDNEEFVREPLSKNHSKSIFLSNIRLINECDIIIANLIPFRGSCIDDGTAFEIGYGYSTNKIIYGYTRYANYTLKEITGLTRNQTVSDEYPSIESFANNSVNLMIQESIENTGGLILLEFEECLKHLKSEYDK